MPGPAESAEPSKLIEIFERDSARVINAETLALTALRKAIISGALPPRTEINEVMVAEHLNISRSPVRQALGILESEGLVRRIYRRGVVVTWLSQEQIEEIYAMRAYLEGLALKRAVPRYSDGYIAKLRTCLAEYPDSRTEDAEAESFVEWNGKFHEMLYEPCGWERLLGVISQLRNNTARYIALSHNMIKRVANSAASHAHILDVCETGDTETIETVIRDHISNAMNLLLAAVKEDPAVQDHICPEPNASEEGV